MLSIQLLRALIATIVIGVSAVHAAEGRPDITRHALAASRSVEQSIAVLADYLAPARFSPADKAWSIFIWIGDRIAYDVDAYLRGQARDTTITADDVLRRRTAVCDGFAALFSAIASAAGLEVTTIQGYAKAYGVAEFSAFSTPNHAWNMVSIDGRWHLIDPTWGAGHVFQDRYAKQLDTVYFLGQIEELKFTHWPIDANWRQMMGFTLSKSQFEAQPGIDPGLFRAGVRGSDISAAIAEPRYAGLVTVFEQNHRGLKVQSIPLAQRLRSDQRYRFQMRADAFDEVVVMNAGTTTVLDGKNGWIDAEFRPAAGSMLVAGRPRDGGRLSGLFQYTVE